MAAVVDYVTSWAARLQSRLYAQFVGDPSWNLWCTDILGPQFQDLEDAAQTLLLLFDIDHGPGGAQLDLIGRIVGQPRAGVDDATYRLYLKARIAANRSDSSPDAIYRVFTALAPGQSLKLTRSPIKSFALTIGGVTADATGLIGLQFLGDAKDAGDRAILEWQEQADASTFTTATATFCGVASLAAATTMQVHAATAALLPASGQVVIDAGLATQETASYTSISASGLMTFAAALTQAHAVGAELELVGDAGLGWGDPNNAATGGQLAWAGQAP